MNVLLISPPIIHGISEKTKRHKADVAIGRFNISYIQFISLKILHLVIQDT